MQVWLLSGAGNDFAVIDARDRTYAMPQIAKALCARLGTDGFMALDRSGKAHIRLHFYNRDGSRATFCGNGARCLCRFAYEMGIAHRHLLLETDAGLHECWRLSAEHYRISLPQPQFPAPGLIRVGVPHYLVRLPRLSFSMGPALREQAAALRKKWDANVNFYAPLDANTLRLLTFERGVEDFTRACGSGCGAVAAALGKPHLRIHCPGGVLETDYAPPRLTLTGPTRVERIVEMSCKGPLA